MGYNTTLVVYNDHFHALEQPDAGKRIVQAIRHWDEVEYHRHANPDHVPRHLLNFGFGMVVAQNHSSESSLVAVGGNYGNVLHRTYHSAHHTKEQQLDLLRAWAEAEGFELVPRQKGGRR